MANYPSLPISQESEFTSDAGLIIDYADDGTVRSRSMFTATRFNISLLHPQVSASEKTTLLSHYSANKGTTFTLSTPWGDNYTVQYLNEPNCKPLSGNYWNITSRLIGVKA